MKILWIDLLCFSSIIKSFNGVYKNSEKICYLNIHKFIKPFVGFLSFLLKKPIIQVDNVILSEKKIGAYSAYEVIQNRLSLYLSTWVDSKDVNDRVNIFTNLNKFSSIKYREHIKESAYYIMYKPVEMRVLSQVYSENSNNIFLLKSSPLNSIIREIYNSCDIKFYTSFLTSDLLVDKRSNYLYDKFTSKQYYSSLSILFFKQFLKWIVSCISGLVFVSRKQSKNKYIGVELLQHRISKNEINDLYWLKDSNINPKSVKALCSVNYDQKSLEELSNFGVEIFMMANKLIINPKYLFSSSRKFYQIVSVSPRYLINTVDSIFRMMSFIFLNNYQGWLKIQSETYTLRGKYWEDIYKNLNISILWSMSDIDSEKMIKSQSVNIVDGLFVGSHWSNYPIYSVINQNCYDVAFTWSKYFSDNFFSHYKSLCCFEVGYPLDFYFERYIDSAKRIKKEFPGKFIISFHDNIVFNDIAYSLNMQLLMHNMFINIINQHDNVLLFLKPKRKHTLDKIVSELPELKYLINAGRIKVFAGSTNRSKAVPAEIGMASDLAIGLGISTAVAECCFSGVVSFHADLTKFSDNKFGNQGLNKVVFRNVSDLENAVLDQINNRGIDIDECKKYHRILDSFQDGCSYKRTGHILSKLQGTTYSQFKEGNLNHKLKEELDEFTC